MPFAIRFFHKNLRSIKIFGTDFGFGESTYNLKVRNAYAVLTEGSTLQNHHPKATILKSYLKMKLHKLPILQTKQCNFRINELLC
jgi:hypothetical protein